MMKNKAKIKSDIYCDCSNPCENSGMCINCDKPIFVGRIIHPKKEEQIFEVIQKFEKTIEELTIENKKLKKEIEKLRLKK